MPRGSHSFQFQLKTVYPPWGRVFHQISTLKISALVPVYNGKGEYMVSMKKTVFLFTIILFFSITKASCYGNLNLVRQIELPNVKGRLDHLAVDPQRQLLFVAAYGNNSLEVIDLRRGKLIRSISGLNRPQDVKYIPLEGLLAVSNGGDGTLRLFDANSLMWVKTIYFRSDADNMRLGPSGTRLYVAYGEGAIGIVSLPGLRRIGDIRLGAHPESFQIDGVSEKMYVNVPGKREIAVIDIRQEKIVSKWRFTPARDNFPMALDEKTHCLFIGAWVPAILVTYDTHSGKLLCRTRISRDADDMYIDPKSGLIYCSCGTGFLDVIAPWKNRHRVISKIHTSPGARTSLLVPQRHRIYVAAPAENGHAARILEFKIE